MRLLWQGGEQTHRGKHYTSTTPASTRFPTADPPDRGRGREAPCGCARRPVGRPIVNTTPDQG